MYLSEPLPYIINHEGKFIYVNKQTIFIFRISNSNISNNAIDVAELGAN